MNRSDSIAVTAFQHPDDRGFEVVVTDPARDPTEVLERQHMAFQERFLGLGAERDMERFARVRQPHHEHPALITHRPAIVGVELAEVDLGLRAGQMRLRDRHLTLRPARARPGGGAT